MPVGKVSKNPIYGSLMIESPGSGGTRDWFELPADSTLTEGTQVTFAEWIRPGAPPGFRYAREIRLLGAPISGGIMPTNISPPPTEPTLPGPAANSGSKSAWGGKLPSTILTSAPTATAAVIVPPTPRATTRPAGPPAPTFSSQNIADDYNNIVNAMTRMTWTGKFGPSLTIETLLRWENPACRELYLTLKGRFHDQPIPGVQRRLYYYFGAIGNWGKAGFRISGHTRTSDKVKQAETQGILHIEN